MSDKRSRQARSNREILTGADIRQSLIEQFSRKLSGITALQVHLCYERADWQVGLQLRLLSAKGEPEETLAEAVSGSMTLPAGSESLEDRSEALDVAQVTRPAAAFARALSQRGR